MSSEWYYVQGSERVGPVDQAEIENLFRDGALNPESYVWRKGFENWETINSVDDLAYLLAPPSSIESDPPSIEVESEDEIGEEFSPDEELSVETSDSAPEESSMDEIDAIPQMGATPEFDFANLNEEQRVISIKVGFDRGGNETEYGPFNLNQIKKAFEENRINEKTFIFIPGMENWQLLGDTPLFAKVSGGLPPQISEEDRRKDVRKPFLARLFFHNNEHVFEGICRDVSVGGLQVLVSDFPGVIGEEVTMNVHPDNSEYCFVANGIIVRVLDGNQGFSLRFKDLDENSRQAISQYIEQN